MNKQSAFMSLLASQKGYITHLHNNLKAYRKAKSEADAQGLQEDEYAFHNAVKHIRKEIKKNEDIQRVLKGMLRGGV